MSTNKSYTDKVGNCIFNYIYPGIVPSEFKTAIHRAKHITEIPKVWCPWFNDTKYSFNVRCSTDIHPAVVEQLELAVRLSDTLKDFLNNGLLNCFIYSIDINYSSVCQQVTINVLRDSINKDDYTTPRFNNVDTYEYISLNRLSNFLASAGYGSSPAVFRVPLKLYYLLHDHKADTKLVNNKLTSDFAIYWGDPAEIRKLITRYSNRYRKLSQPDTLELLQTSGYRNPHRLDYLQGIDQVDLAILSFSLNHHTLYCNNRFAYIECDV